MSQFGEPHRYSLTLNDASNIPESGGHPGVLNGLRGPAPAPGNLTTYPAFVSGFGGTAHDGVTIQSVSGSVVSAQVVAAQTDGTVKTYQRTYTVAAGVITQFNGHQVG
jgi:hypothetical protein